MHEWALAEAVAVAAVRAAEREGIETITELRVTLGELQSLEQDIFEFGLRELLAHRASVSADLRVTFRCEPARFHCRACGSDWSLSAPDNALPPDQREAIHFLPEIARAYLKCPRCGSPDFAVTAGRGITAVSVVGVRRRCADDSGTEAPAGGREN